MVRVSERELFENLVNEKNLGAIVFLKKNGEEQIYKYHKGELVVVSKEDEAVVLLGSKQNIYGEPAKVESLEVVVRNMNKPIEEVIACWSSVLLYTFEVMRLYRAANKGTLKIGREGNLWRVTESNFRSCREIIRDDLPNMRDGLLNGVDLGKIRYFFRDEIMIRGISIPLFLYQN